MFSIWVSETYDIKLKMKGKVGKDRIKKAESHVIKHFKARKPIIKKKLTKEFGTNVTINKTDSGSILLHLQLEDDGDDIIRYIMFLDKSGILSDIFQNMITQKMKDKCELEKMSVKASFLTSKSHLGNYQLSRR